MQVETLREFVAIAEKSSFTLAAKMVNISQPALSNHIKTMEHDLGYGKLFERSKGSNGAQLTPAGRIFYEDVKSLLAAYDQAVERYRAAQKQRHGQIKVALSPLSPFCNARLLDLMREFNETYPNVDFSLKIYLPEDILESLDKGEIDCSVLVQRTSPDEKRYPTVALCREETCILLPHSHPLALQTSISPADCTPFPQVHNTHGDIEMTLAFQRELFGSVGIEPRFSLRSSPSLDDFFINDIHGNDIVIVPRSFSECAPLRLRPDLALRGFDPPLFEDTRIIFRDYAENPMLETFAAFLDDAAEAGAAPETKAAAETKAASDAEAAAAVETALSSSRGASL